MRIKLLLALLLVALLLPGQVFAQDPNQDNLLRITVVYDPDGDGQSEGVGFGTPVTIRESGTQQEYFNFTRAEDSAADFYVFERTYILNAYPRQTRLFFTWVCNGSVVVDEPFEPVVLRCTEQFFIRLPWAIWS